ncbi:ABC transporter permease [Staphylococcus felis]|uniref:ABC transporter permease n=1 Tax=Staphylococcus felis TaxID=46127 RepID=UPI0039673876
MSKFWATFKLTYSKKLKSKAFIITTIFMILVIVLGANIDKIASMFQGDDNQKIGIITQDQSLYQAIQSQGERLNEETNYSRMTEREAKAKIKDESLDKAYMITESKDHLLSAQILTREASTQSDKAELSAILSQIQTQKVASDLGLNATNLQQLQREVSVQDQLVSNSDKSSYNTNKEEEVFSKIIVMVGTFMMFFIILTYAQQIAMELATEKVSRVSEMIITSVKPTIHILAKISAVLTVALTQILVLGVTSVIAYVAFDLQDKLSELDIHLTGHMIRLIIFAVIFLILGVLTYVILASIFGNLTARIEDMAQSMMPLNLLMIAAFYAGYFGAMNPNSMIIKVLSYVPFFSPFVTLTRMSLPETPTFEGIIVIVIHMILIGLLIWIAAKTYRNAVLTFEKGVIKSLKRVIPKKS